MVEYLLDTCAISDIVESDPNTIINFKSFNPLNLAVSTITIMEIKFGLNLKPAKAGKIEPSINKLLSQIIQIPFGNEEAAYAARIRSDLKQAGTPIGAYDLLIGATALVHNLILVTSNVREFQRIDGLTIENWRN